MYLLAGIILINAQGERVLFKQNKVVSKREANAWFKNERRYLKACKAYLVSARVDHVGDCCV